MGVKLEISPALVGCFCLLSWGLEGCAGLQHGPVLDAQPEAGSGFDYQNGIYLPHEAVAAANPWAAQAGARILAAGGNAVDAAVAVQLVLGVVEPQSSGLGGGGFLVLWDGHTVRTWDGRETAPAAADGRLFAAPGGGWLSRSQAIQSGLSVGVPGVLRMLEDVHRAEGRLPWAQLFAPAIALAEQGFPVSPRLQGLLAQSEVLRANAAARAFYYQPAAPGASPASLKPWPVGTVLHNPALAEVMRRVAAEGSAAFYGGPVAQSIVDAVHAPALAGPGRMALSDLAGYQSVARAPLCMDWQTRWRLCGMAPPSSGPLTVMQQLSLMSLRGMGPAVNERLHWDAAWLHGFAETERLAFADRDRFVGDPLEVAPPGGDWHTLLASAYLHERLAMLGTRSLGVAPAGHPVAGEPWRWGDGGPLEEHGTSHISIVDREGHAVSFTTSIESAFGTGILVDGGTGLPGGFLLNNELTDFHFQPTDAEGRPVANRVAPGKRPRSSMSPMLVFERRTDGGQGAYTGAPPASLYMVVGSPGGSAIIPYVAQFLWATLQDGISPDQAVALPHVAAFNTHSTYLEAGRFDAATVQALAQRGHRVEAVELVSGTQVLMRSPQGGWWGASDPRREGTVAGD
jgi:gamma-glutamyltranspeptidase / glutathione hydrolase